MTQSGPTGSDNPKAVAEEFLQAIYEGDPGLIWSSFSAEARSFVVARGVRRGMAFELGQALLQGSADPIEEVEFLADLLGGIEKDLANVDLGQIVINDVIEPVGEEKVRIRFSEQFSIDVGPKLEPLPVGSVELVKEGAGWKVDRLIPRPG